MKEKKYQDRCKFVVERVFRYAGRPCIVTFNPIGFRCGYVGLRKGDALYGKDYDDINTIDVHCGLTFSGFDAWRDRLAGTEKIWWLGFDCGHAGDLNDYESQKKYYGVHRKPAYELDGGHMWTFEEVESEIYRVIDQLPPKKMII